MNERGGVSPRILFIGENWHGSNATSCKRAFRHLGCDVLDIDDYHYWPVWQSKKMRAARRLLRPWIVREFGNAICRLGETFRPELVFVFKGSMVRPETLTVLRNGGAVLVNFYPDWDFGEFYKQVGNNFLDCIRSYDVLFTPKSNHVDRFRKAGVRRVEFLPYAYDPWCHYPVKVNQAEQELFQSDITFIGSWGEERAEILESLVGKSFPYTLGIWGNNWERLHTGSSLRKYCHFAPAYGEMQAKILASCKIALAFLRPPDLHTARTFEIPAQGAFMLAERSLEHITFFHEDIEIACFNDVHELREKIDYYHSYEEQRREIAKAGYQLVTKGGNSYIDRMERVLQVYREIVSGAIIVSKCKE